MLYTRGSISATCASTQILPSICAITLSSSKFLSQNGRCLSLVSKNLKVSNRRFYLISKRLLNNMIMAIFTFSALLASLTRSELKSETMTESFKKVRSTGFPVSLITSICESALPSHNRAASGIQNSAFIRSQATIIAVCFCCVSSCLCSHYCNVWSYLSVFRWRYDPNSGYRDVISITTFLVT